MSFLHKGKRIGKRLLSIVLVVALVLGLIPQSVYATEVSGEPVVTQQSYESDGCIITYKEVNSWGNYVNADVVIENQTENDKSLWKLDLFYDGYIETIWNADIISSDNGHYVIGAKTYNTTIAAGQSVSFGFTAYGEDAKPEFPFHIAFVQENTGTDNGSTGDGTGSDGTGGETGGSDDTDDGSDNTDGGTTDGSTAGQDYVIPEEWKGLNYALFTSGEGNLSLYTGNTSITGSVHTNENFYYQGNTLTIDGVLEAGKGISLSTSSNEGSLSITSKLEQAQAIAMPDITEELYAYVAEHGTIYEENKDFNTENVVIESPIGVTGSASFHTTTFLGKGILYAKDSVTYNVGALATPQDSKVFIASENGNITLNGSDLSLNAVLYAPNGTVTINANSVNLNGRIIAKQVCINGTTINIQSSASDFEMIDFLFRSELDLIVGGNQKENRKVTLTLDVLTNEDQIVKEDTVWTITKEGMPVEDAYAVDEANSNGCYKELIFKEAGTYIITAVATTGMVDYTVSKKVVITKDLAPVAGFTIDSNSYTQNEEGIATILLSDCSSSPDGDAIGSRIWTLYHDKNGDGAFTEEEGTVISSGNETGLSYGVTEAGRYQVVLRVVETYGDTIPSLLTTEDYLWDDTMDTEGETGIFEVKEYVKEEVEPGEDPNKPGDSTEEPGDSTEDSGDNPNEPGDSTEEPGDNPNEPGGSTEEVPEEKPEEPTLPTLDMEKSKSVDVIFTVGEASEEKTQTYKAKAEELRNSLAAEGVDARVEVVSSATYNAQSTFAWKAYDHNYCKEYYCPAMKNHILIEGNDIKMVGYNVQALRDFLYIPNDDPGEKIFEFDLQRDETDWHSMDGAGFLFNTKVDEENNLIQGFYILFGDGTARVVWFEDDLDWFRDNGAFSFKYRGNTLHGIMFPSTYESRHIKVVVDEKTMSLWADDDLLIDNLVLPETNYGYGFGPMIDHNGHFCPQQSYFTFKNLTMTCAGGNKLSAIVDGYDWREGASHYVVHMSDEAVPDLSGDEEVSNLSAALLRKNASFIGIGSEKSEEQYKEVLLTSETEGFCLDLADLTSAMNTLNASIVKDVMAKDYSIGRYITTDDIVAYKGFYENVEGKPVYKQNWHYAYAKTILTSSTENTGDDIKTLTEPMALFTTTGAYGIASTLYGGVDGERISLLWNGTQETERLLIVQSRPLADVSVELLKHDTDEKLCIANVTYTSYDPDHKSEDDKGIREEYYWYKNIKDGSWTEGMLPNNLLVGETYLVKYQVKDMEGTWSYPAVKAIHTEEFLVFKETVDEVAPEVFLQVPKLSYQVGEEIQIDGYATDDYGVSDFALYLNDEKLLNYMGRAIYTGQKPGIMKIRAVATDLGGNTGETELTIQIVDDRDTISPTAMITTPVSGSELGFNIEVYGSAMDESKLAKYTLSYRAKEDTEYQVFYEDTKAVKEDLLGVLDISTLPSGYYEILLTSEDEIGNVSYYGIYVFVENENPEEVKEDTKRPFTVNLSKSRANIGEAVQAQVTLPENIKEETVTVFLGDTEIASNTRKVTFTSYDVGTAILTAKAVTDEGEAVSVKATCQFYNASDATPPVVMITSPAMDKSLSEPVDIIGTVQDEEGLLYWKLEYRMKGEDSYQLLAEGSKNRKEEVLGNLDTTMLLNGQYEIKLTAKDQGGNVVTCKNEYVLEGNLKVGAMHLGFTDITATMGGTNVSVNRIYDSRNKQKGDFGIGWTLGMQGMELMENTNLSVGYEVVRSGSGFSTGYQIVETMNHDVVVTYGDGTSDRFELAFSPERQALVPISETTLSYRCVTNQKVKLEVLADTTAYVSGTELMFYDDTMEDALNYKLTTEDGNEIYLNATKGVYQVVDSTGNKIAVDKDGYHGEDEKSLTFTRDMEGRIIKAEDPLGNVMTYTYDEAGDLVAVTDAADRTVTYTYDKEHNLASIIDPMGIAVARNEYDDSGRLVATIDAEGNRVEYDYDVEGRTQIVKDRRGNTTVYTYDDNGNILQTVDAYGNKTTNTYDSFNNLLSTTDANGNTTGYAYDESGNVTEVTAPDGTKVESTYTQENYVSGITMMDKTVMAMEYDSKGRIASVEDANGNETEYTYSGDGKLTGLTDAIGTYQTITYDEDGNVASVVNGAGGKTEYTYDEKNRCTGITVTRVEKGEKLTSTSSYAYNEAGEVTKSIDGLGNVTSYEYDENGNQTASIDANGNRITYTYDDSGNLIKTIYPDGTFETFTYDANGNNITATDRTGLTVTMKYDKLDRMVEKAYADGTKETYEYDKVGNVIKQVSVTGAVTTYTYDERNRNTSITDTYGNTTTFSYDEAARLTRRTDAEGNTTAYEYDDNGNLTKTIYADGTSVISKYDARNRVIRQEDQYGNETLYEYDGSDNLTKVTDAYGYSHIYEYDLHSNLITIKDSVGHRTFYTYDEAGRVKTITPEYGCGEAYSYDETGNVISYSRPNGITTTYTYDNMNRMTEKVVGTETTSFTYNEEGLLTAVTDKTGTISYQYDRYNRLIKQTDVRGVELSYTYDEAGRLHTFDNGFGTTTYEYDLMDRVTRVIDRNGKATIYEYDALGNRSAMRYPNGNVVTYTYDACQRLKEEWIVNADGVTLAKYTYGIGKAGERTSITEVNSSGIETTTTYEYDKLLRLTKETIERDENQLIYEYTYDALGNRLTKKTTIEGEVSALANTTQEGVTVVEGTIHYTYNIFNQLGMEYCEDEWNQYKVTYQYNHDGTLLRQEGSREIYYEYDKEGRLSKVYNTIGYKEYDTETYTYDYNGNRTSKTDKDGNTTYYVNDTSGSLTMVVAETDEAGKEKAYYTRGLELISMEKEGEIWYYLYDGHGNVRNLTNEEGRVTDRYTYEAYGTLIENKGDTENEFLYTGEQYNIFSGFYYLRARYMNPATGTFISKDSYQGNIYDPVTLHKYLYANANPVMYTDPSGYFSLAECSISTSIQTTLNSMHQIAGLQRLVKWADAMCTVYDVAMEVRNAILGGGTVLDVMGALLKGVVVGFMVDGMCKTSLGIILKPMMAIFGLGDQVDQIQKALESGDPAEIAVRFVQLACMLFGITSQCFTGDTLVSTEEGLRPIEEIEVGDFVWAEDTTTGDKELKEVIRVFESETDTLVHVTTESGTEIDTTKKHPFYVEGRGWCAAVKLEEGDVLQTKDGKTEVVADIKVEELDESVTVYNLEVKDSHTYYVSTDEVLVHNDCGEVPESIENIGNGELSESQGFGSFWELKRAIGSAGEGNHWHHIVEQSQIGKSGFSAEQIHNIANIIAIDKSTHAKITGYYNNKSFDFTNGLSVRDWLAGQSFEFQYKFGLDVLKQYGVIK